MEDLVLLVLHIVLGVLVMLGTLSAREAREYYNMVAVLITAISLLGWFATSPVIHVALSFNSHGVTISTVEAAMWALIKEAFSTMISALLAAPIELLRRAIVELTGLELE